MLVYLYLTAQKTPDDFWSYIEFIGVMFVTFLLGLVDLAVLIACIVSFFEFTLFEFIMITLGLYTLTAILYLKFK